MWVQTWTSSTSSSEMPEGQENVFSKCNTQYIYEECCSSHSKSHKHDQLLKAIRFLPHPLPSKDTVGEEKICKSCWVQCSNTKQWSPTYLRKGTPVQLCEEGPGNTGSDDHRNWTRRWQKGKTSNLHLVKTLWQTQPLCAVLSASVSLYRCWGKDQGEISKE